MSTVETPSTEKLAQQQRLMQAQIRAATTRDFLKLAPLWTGDTQSFTRLLQATITLIRARYQVSAAAGLAFYQAVRAAEEVPGFATPRLASAISVEQITKSLYYTGQTMTRNALQAGQSPQEARRTALARLSGSVSRLVLDGGRESVMGSVAADAHAHGWARVTDGNPCYFCLTLASRGAVYKSDESAGFQAHDHCVPSGTLVSGPSVELGFRRWYEGEIIVVRTAEGGELSITPNHPVLTERGWVEAGLLREGDYVLGRAGADLDTLRVPHENDVPAPIEEIWGAAGMDLLRSVPVAAQDFHGDGGGSQGNVDVVAPHRLLAHVRDVEQVELATEKLDAWTRSATVADSFSGEGDLALMLLAVGGAAPCCVCGGADLEAALTGEFGRGGPGGFAPVASRDAEFGEPALYGGSRDAVAGREVLLGLTGGVAVADIRRDREPIPGRRGTTGTRYNPAPTESDAERLRIHAELGRDLAKRLAGGVELRRVLELRRVQMTGHVYNLQTVEGWYEADGVIVSNCGCTAMPVFDGTQIPNLQRWRDIYDAAQNEGESSGLLQPGENSSKARLNAVRQYLAAEHV